MQLHSTENLVLLENMNFKGGGGAQPIANAQILAYNEETHLYKIKYQLHASGAQGEIEVPKERLQYLR